MDRESIINRYIKEYDIEVPKEKVENELQFMVSDLRHRMHYSTMTGGEFILNPAAKINDSMDELEGLAFMEVKTELVLKKLIKELNISVSVTELNEEANRISKQENSDIEMLKRFFGDGFELLKADIQRKKVLDWIVENCSDE